MLPLVAQGLAGDVAAACDCFADVLPTCWHVVCELHRDARHKPACVADIAAAAREEEAGCQTLLVVVAARYCPRDGRLARPRQAAQPEDAALILPVRPAVYNFQEVDARVGQTCRLVLLGVCIERRVFGVW